jgi:hypothetical protein
MTISFEEFEPQLLADPDVRREYEALAPEFAVIANSLRARLVPTPGAPGLAFETGDDE